MNQKSKSIHNPRNQNTFDNLLVISIVITDSWAYKGMYTDRKNLVKIL